MEKLKRAWAFLQRHPEMSMVTFNAVSIFMGFWIKSFMYI